ncbi:MAG: helicase-related protein, partial [Candidatus Thermoplasmatota archaeon]
FFVNTRDSAEFLVSQFRKWNEQLPLGIHHGSLSKEVRTRMEEAFKAQLLKALVATSSLELGIDIGSADFVLQYNSPRQVSRLIQRVGRSGHRIGEISKGAIIATTADELAESFIIARKALNEELEAAKIREVPLAVLANQIIAFGLTGKCSIERAYKTITRAYPFRNLSFRQFINVLTLLRNQRLLFVENGSFKAQKLGREYFYENISMIPDERVYHVIDLATRESIGSLDESFVVSYLEEDKSFTMKGQSWVVSSIESDRIFVTPCSEGEIPSWIGEEIPVPFEVAVEVGALRRTVVENEVIELKPFREYIETHRRVCALVPNDKLITIEKGDNLIILNACFGSKVNQTLAQLISTLLASQIGSSVGVHSDAYRIILELPESIDNAFERVQEYLKTMKIEALESFIKASLKNASLFKWYLLHVAKKFGALKKDADYRVVSLRKILDALKDTLIWEETIAKILWDKMDIERTKLVLAKIQTGDIEIKGTKLTPIGLEGYARRKELVLPERAEMEILELLKKRLESKRISVVCLSCKKARGL